MVSKQNPHSCTVSMTMLALLFLYKGRQSYQRWTAAQEEERWQAEWIYAQQVKYNHGRRREFLNIFISTLSEFLISHPCCPLSTNFWTFSREDISGIFYDQYCCLSSNKSLRPLPTAANSWLPAWFTQGQYKSECNDTFTWWITDGSGCVEWQGKLRTWQHCKLDKEGWLVWVAIMNHECDLLIELCLVLVQSQYNRHFKYRKIMAKLKSQYYIDRTIE